MEENITISKKEYEALIKENLKLKKFVKNLKTLLSDEQ